jgi:hypothetical protein
MAEAAPEGQTPPLDRGVASPLERLHGREFTRGPPLPANCFSALLTADGQMSPARQAHSRRYPRASLMSKPLQHLTPADRSARYPGRGQFTRRNHLPLHRSALRQHVCRQGAA